MVMSLFTTVVVVLVLLFPLYGHSQIDSTVEDSSTTAAETATEAPTAPTTAPTTAAPTTAAPTTAPPTKAVPTAAETTTEAETTTAAETTTEAETTTAAAWAMNATQTLQLFSDSQFRIFAVVAFFIILFLVAVCVVLAFASTPNIGSRDEKEDSSVQRRSVSPVLGRWKRTFDKMFIRKQNPVDSLPIVRSVIDVPIDMDLDICSELPPLLAKLAKEEKEQRATRVAAEATAFRRICVAASSERGEFLPKLRQEATSEFLPRGAVSGMSILERSESDSRGEICVEESRERLSLSLREQERWKGQMNRRGVALSSKLQASPNWRARRAQMLESRQSVLRHIDHTLPMQMIAASPSEFRDDPQLPGQIRSDRRK